MPNRLYLVCLIIAAGITVAGGAPCASYQSDTPHRILIKPGDIPAPYSTPSIDAGPKIVAKPDGASLHVPRGFHVDLFAEGLQNPRWVTVAPNGDVFVAESGAGRISVFRPDHVSGLPGPRNVFATGLKMPFAILFYKTWIYVADTDAVVRFTYRDGQLKADGPPETVVPDLPTGGMWTRGLAQNPRNGKMYVSCGAHADECEETDPRRAAVSEFNPDGTGFHVYATGLRNAVAIAFEPHTDRLWATVNERDFIGEDVPPDFFTSVKQGGFYGFPYYYVGNHHDPRMPERPDLAAKLVTPEVLITCHSAPLGVVFYTGSQFPKEYRGDAFVALHGSANRKVRTGYDVIRIPFHNGKPVGGYEAFLTGWMLSENSSNVWGRPVGLAVAKDGSLLVTDDGANKVWRVSYSRSMP